MKTLLLLILCTINCIAQPQLPKVLSGVVRPQRANVSLAWDPNGSTGYNLYYGGTSHIYTNMINAGSATNVTVSNLFVGATYYFAATAYNLIGLESPFSSEVAYTIPKPVAKPVTNVFTVIGTNISSGPTMTGPWTRLAPTNATSFSFTNPAGSQFFRGKGKIVIRKTIL